MTTGGAEHRSLPPALERWRRWLAWFSDDLVAVLGPVLLRLDPLLGAAASARLRGPAEPDGIEDLRRRGSYERLLLSEWAVADASPDEFLRRAASGEHLFLAPRLVARKTDNVLIALFDAGPAQLGAARLLHVALWILLARRAEHAGARFLWGVLQAPEATHEANSPDDLRALLGARRLDTVAPRQLATWATALTQEPLNGAEVWAISGHQQELPGRTHSVTVKRHFDGSIRVDLARGSQRHSLRLELPAPKVGARLLSGDFLAARPSPSRRNIGGSISLQQPPLINGEARHVAVLLVDRSEAVIVTLPQQGARNARKTHKMRRVKVQTLIAACMNGTSLVGIYSCHDGLGFLQIPGLAYRALPPRECFQAPPGLTQWLSCLLLDDRQMPGSLKVQRRFVVLDQARNLVSWASSDRPRDQHILIDRHVLGLAPSGNDRAIYGCYEDGAFNAKLLRRDGHADSLLRAPATHAPTRCFFQGMIRGPTWAGGIAVEPARRSSSSDPVRWVVHVLPRSLLQVEIVVPAEARVVGLVRNAGDYALVAIRPNGRTLALYGRGAPVDVYTANAGIATATVASDRDVIAFVTHERELIVLGDGGQSQLYKIGSAAKSADD